MLAKLTDICDIQYGYAFDSAQFSETEGIPLVRIRDVVRGFSETRTTESFPEEYTVHNGDILIGMDGEFNIAHWNGGTIINYVRENGDIDKSDLVNTEPFDNYDLLELFGERLSTVLAIVNVLHNSIMANAA